MQPGTEQSGIGFMAQDSYVVTIHRVATKAGSASDAHD
jgi:hypothetical protein